MTKTEHYQLNQWERSDKVLMDDFNADNAAVETALTGLDAKIDAAQADLGGKIATKADAASLTSAQATLQTAIDKKADATALEALQTTVSAKGNCTIATGSYSGTGATGTSFSRTLTFSFVPRLVFVGGGASIGIFAYNSRYGTVCVGSSTSAVKVTWLSNGFSWTPNNNTQNAASMLNEPDATYRYIAFK